ncbi:hypothetical protein GFY24_12170 [Nocardia sp. SYP-A9097]|uniref:hypothetical protein n=1 Tax=Nocardia sp. SYP-A9097 TaxID=2663237 RepID=UPI00129A5C0D|nr:hypothetical protein [Nocardia sp. SYP-A9097]MRH88190.1 hypothetical protein [Nocardia sp. SYP-A9097]
MIGEGMFFLLGIATGGTGLWLATVAATVRSTRPETYGNGWTVESIRSRIEQERTGDSKVLSNSPLVPRHSGGSRHTE